jgi:hypothetical protein
MCSVDREERAVARDVVRIRNFYQPEFRLMHRCADCVEPSVASIGPETVASTQTQRQARKVLFCSGFACVRNERSRAHIRLHPSQ